MYTYVRACVYDVHNRFTRIRVLHINLQMFVKKYEDFFFLLNKVSSYYGHNYYGYYVCNYSDSRTNGRKLPPAPAPIMLIKNMGNHALFLVNWSYLLHTTVIFLPYKRFNNK